MKILSWNVNSVRSLGDGFGRVLDKLDADIVCLQETKLQRSTLEATYALPDGYDTFMAFSNSAKGYSGVATYASRRRSRFAVPLAGEAGLLGKEDDFSVKELAAMDQEGRVVVTDHGPFVLVNVYVPCTASPERLAFKLRFCLALQRKVEGIRALGRKVIVVGDLNICYLNIDRCEADKDARALTWHAHPTRTWLVNMLARGGGPLEDSFRLLHPGTEGAYTCWSTKTSARETNYGVRIDYILVDRELTEALRDSQVHPDVHGSDHCPVSVELDEHTWPNLPDVPRPSAAGCSKFYPGLVGRQAQLTNFTVRAEEGTKRKEPGGEMPIPSPALGAHNRTEEAKKRNQPGGGKRLRQAKVAAFFKPDSAPTSARVLHGTPNSETGTEPDGLGNLGFENAESRPGGLKASVGAWKELLKGPRKPPPCRKHGEPSVLREVKKDGPNKGRRFFVCHRPEGAADNPKARCNFFEWY